ncbi:Protein TOPAZ1 [Dissostichus eleginoides]|uniref:Protein TOPAZ1 n=1 Tax=Dissostichus eleginoides TaxID=100907 RepID=A0AAD9FBV1_DISEL|nr:Protein TOPAZ1 [Dissostichus eleginoides]
MEQLASVAAEKRCSREALQQRSVEALQQRSVAAEKVCSVAEKRCSREALKRCSREAEKRCSREALQLGSRHTRCYLILAGVRRGIGLLVVLMFALKHFRISIFRTPKVGFAVGP